jgi:hypothetical protein
MSWVQSKDVNLERFELVWTKIRVGTSQKGHKLRKEWVLASLQIYRSAEALWGCCEVRESNGSSANGAQRKGAILHTTNQWNLSQYVLKQDKHCPSTSSKHIQSISTSKLYQTSPNISKLRQTSPKVPRFSSCELCIPWSPKPMFIVPGCRGARHRNRWLWDWDLYCVISVRLFSDVCMIVIWYIYICFLYDSGMSYLTLWFYGCKWALYGCFVMGCHGEKETDKWHHLWVSQVLHLMSMRMNTRHVSMFGSDSWLSASHEILYDGH